jgi:uncharacterized protein (DUF427 family)
VLVKPELKSWVRRGAVRETVDVERRLIVVWDGIEIGEVEDATRVVETGLAKTNIVYILKGIMLH